MGGDEFMMILPDIGAQENAIICVKIHAAFSEPVRIGDQVAACYAKFWIEHFARDGPDHEKP